jgi:hypothetical protein
LVLPRQRAVRGTSLGNGVAHKRKRAIAGDGTIIFYVT